MANDEEGSFPAHLAGVYREATAAAAVGVWSWELEVDALWWSPTPCELYGVEGEGTWSSNDYV